MEDDGDDDVFNTNDSQLDSDLIDGISQSEFAESDNVFSTEQRPKLKNPNKEGHSEVPDDSHQLDGVAAEGDASKVAKENNNVKQALVQEKGMHDSNVDLTRNMVAEKHPESLTAADEGFKKLQEDLEEFKESLEVLKHDKHKTEANEEQHLHVNNEANLNDDEHNEVTLKGFPLKTVAELKANTQSELEVFSGDVDVAHSTEQSKGDSLNNVGIPETDGDLPGGVASVGLHMQGVSSESGTAMGSTDKPDVVEEYQANSDNPKEDPNHGLAQDVSDNAAAVKQKVDHVTDGLEIQLEHINLDDNGKDKNIVSKSEIQTSNSDTDMKTETVHSTAENGAGDTPEKLEIQAEHTNDVIKGNNINEHGMKSGLAGSNDIDSERAQTMNLNTDYSKTEKDQNKHSSDNDEMLMHVSPDFNSEHVHDDASKNFDSGFHDKEDGNSSILQHVTSYAEESEQEVNVPRYSGISKDDLHKSELTSNEDTASGPETDKQFVVEFNAERSKDAEQPHVSDETLDEANNIESMVQKEHTLGTGKQTADVPSNIMYETHLHDSSPDPPTDGQELHRGIKVMTGMASSDADKSNEDMKRDDEDQSVLQSESPDFNNEVFSTSVLTGIQVTLSEQDPVDNEQEEATVVTAKLTEESSLGPLESALAEKQFVHSANGSEIINDPNEKEQSPEFVRESALDVKSGESSVQNEAHSTAVHVSDIADLPADIEGKADEKQEDRANDDKHVASVVKENEQTNSNEEQNTHDEAGTKTSYSYEQDPHQNEGKQELLDDEAKDMKDIEQPGDSASLTNSKEHDAPLDEDQKRSNDVGDDLKKTGSDVTIQDKSRDTSNENLKVNEEMTAQSVTLEKEKDAIDYEEPFAQQKELADDGSKAPLSKDSNSLLEISGEPAKTDVVDGDVTLGLNRLSNPDDINLHKNLNYSQESERVESNAMLKERDNTDSKTLTEPQQDDTVEEKEVLVAGGNRNDETRKEGVSVEEDSPGGDAGSSVRDVDSARQKLLFLEQELKAKMTDEVPLAHQAYRDAMDLRVKLTDIINELKGIKSKSDPGSTKLASQEAKELKERLKSLEEMLDDWEDKGEDLLSQTAERDEEIKQRIVKLEEDLAKRDRQEDELFQARQEAHDLKHRIDKLEALLENKQLMPESHFIDLAENLKTEVEERKLTDSRALMATQRETGILQKKLMDLENQLSSRKFEDGEKVEAMNEEADRLKKRLVLLEEEVEKRKHNEEKLMKASQEKEEALLGRILSLEIELDRRKKDEKAILSTRDEAAELRGKLNLLDSEMRKLLESHDPYLQRKLKSLEDEVESRRSEERDSLRKAEEHTQSLQNRISEIENTLKQRDESQSSDQEMKEMVEIKDQLQNLQHEIKLTSDDDASSTKSHSMRELALESRIKMLEENLENLREKEPGAALKDEVSLQLNARVKSLEMKLQHSAANFDQTNQHSLLNENALDKSYQRDEDKSFANLVRSSMQTKKQCDIHDNIDRSESPSESKRVSNETSLPQQSTLSGERPGKLSDVC